jgi:hypothetical protein
MEKDFEYMARWGITGMDSPQLVLSKGTVVVTWSDSSHQGVTKVDIKEDTLNTPTPAEFETAFQRQKMYWRTAHAPPGPYFLPPEQPGSSSSLGPSVPHRSPLQMTADYIDHKPSVLDGQG